MAREKVIGIGTSVQNGAVEILANGTVTVYQAGTSTPITVYDAATGGGTTITTNSDGEFFFWIDWATTAIRVKIEIVTAGYDDVIEDDVPVFTRASFVLNDSGVSGDSVKDALDALVGGGKLFFPVQTNDSDVGDIPVMILASADIKIPVIFPSNFTSIDSMVIWVIPAFTDGTADLDIDSDYAADGEGYNTHSESDAASTYSITANQNFEIDVSGIFTSVAAGDRGGVGLTNNEISGVRVVGIILEYS